MDSAPVLQKLNMDSFSSEREPQHGEETHYVWKIENFSMCPQRKGGWLKSSDFFVDSMDESKFCLRLYPRGRSDSQTENVSCFLECVTEADYYITVESYVRTSTGSAIFEKIKKDFCLRQGSKVCLLNIPDREDMFSKRALILPMDILTICCIIKPVYRASYCCDEDFSALSNDLTRLFNSKIFSDLTLCASGHKFHVHKFILATRASALAANIGLLDDHQIDEVSVDTIPVPVLRPLLNYLYSGKLEEDLSPIVLNGLYEAAKTFEMDDLRRDIFPLETRTVARTSIKVNWRLVWWNIEDFEVRVAEADWPISTFFDLNLGKFVIDLNITEDSPNPLLKINIHSKSILVKEDCIFVKSKVLVFKEQDGRSSELCSGEYWFEQKEGTSDLDFTMLSNTEGIKGTCNKYPEKLQLAFEFSISYPQHDIQSQSEQITHTLLTPKPALTRSFQRLCADLDIVWKDSCLESDYQDDDLLLNFSDVNLRLKNETIRSHNAILSVRSDTFSDMIIHRIATNKEYLNISELDKETLLDLLRYVYSGKTKEKSFDYMKALYIAAVKYKIQSLVIKCSRIIAMAIKSENICEVLSLADEYRDNDLMKSVVNFIQSYRKDVLESPGWLFLTAKSPHLATKTLIMLSKKIASDA